VAPGTGLGLKCPSILLSNAMFFLDAGSGTNILLIRQWLNYPDEGQQKMREKYHM
jgi:hypothetical protein